MNLTVPLLVSAHIVYLQVYIALKRPVKQVEALSDALVVN